MAKKRNSKLQVRQSVARASNARLAARRKMEGKVYSEIAAELGISITTVCRLVNEQKEFWQTQAQEDTAAWILDALEEIRMVKAEAWLELERSKRPREILEENETPRGTFSKTRLEGQCADPRYMKVIHDCIRQEAELRGALKTIQQQTIHIVGRGERTIEQILAEDFAKMRMGLPPPTSDGMKTDGSSNGKDNGDGKNDPNGNGSGDGHGDGHAQH